MEGLTSIPMPHVDKINRENAVSPTILKRFSAVDFAIPESRDRIQATPQRKYSGKRRKNRLRHLTGMGKQTRFCHERFGGCPRRWKGTPSTPRRDDHPQSPLHPRYWQTRREAGTQSYGPLVGRLAAEGMRSFAHHASAVRRPRFPGATVFDSPSIPSEARRSRAGRARGAATGRLRWN